MESVAPQMSPSSLLLLACSMVREMGAAVRPQRLGEPPHIPPHWYGGYILGFEYSLSIEFSQLLSYLAFVYQSFIVFLSRFSAFDAWKTLALLTFFFSCLMGSVGVQVMTASQQKSEYVQLGSRSMPALSQRWHILVIQERLGGTCSRCRGLLELYAWDEIKVIAVFFVPV